MAKRLFQYGSAGLLALVLSLPFTTALAAYPAAAAYGAAATLVAERQAVISPAQAVAAAVRVVPGRVLGASRVRRGGRLLYRVKILTRAGVLRVVYVDAHTGRVQ